VSSAPTSTDLVHVEVVDEEQIVPHGSAGTTWWVRVHDAWSAAAALPGASVTSLDPGPGTVWRRQIELNLPRGTRLLRVESAPLVERRTPLEYLARKPTAARKVRKTEFWAGPGWRLMRGPLKSGP
jgi:hypothetical protein